MKKAVAALNLASILFAFALTGICLVKAESSPKTIVVPDDYPSITAAVKNANDGETVYVRAGNYTVDENSEIAIYRAISLIEENPQNTVIAGNFSIQESSQAQP